MRILAVCDRRYVEATRKVVGERAVVITSPPVFASDLKPTWLEGRDFIYVDLHGQPGSVYLWSGPRQERAAMSVHTVREADLSGAVVFAATCFLPSTPFLVAFLEAGAEACIGGRGENYGTKRRLVGAQLLARYLVQNLREGDVLEEAFGRARRRLRMNVRAWIMDPKETRDTLGFRIWRRRDGDNHGEGSGYDDRERRERDG